VRRDKVEDRWLCKGRSRLSRNGAARQEILPVLLGALRVRANSWLLR
jgi:hypothetical protein